MATYNVDSDLVAASAANIGATAERIRTEVASMMADLLALQDTWTGVASANFAELTASWRATQTQVESSLESSSTQLSAAANVYADAESQTVSLFA